MASPAPVPEAAQSVVEQTRRQEDKGQSPAEKGQGTRNQRTAERQPFVTQLTILITDPNGKPRTLNVASHDISTGGFSFIHKQFVYQNTRVQVHFESLPGNPTLEGVVRSCIHVGGMHHRVGVQFVTPIAPEQVPSNANSQP